MLGKTFGILSLIALFFAFFTNNVTAVSEAVFEGAQAAVSLSVSLLGIMCLWNGIMEVLKEAGLVAKLARFLRPFLRFFFPDSPEGKGEEEIAACVSANLLGLGNASTPLALAALDKMKKNARGEPPTRDMITLAVMNTASFSLLPTTIVSLRHAAGSENPFRVVAPIWLCSFCGFLLALFLCRAVGALCRHVD